MISSAPAAADGLTEQRLTAAVRTAFAGVPISEGEAIAPALLEATAQLAAFYADQAAAELEAWAARTAPAGYYFDGRAADRACAFFPRYLRHTKGRWRGQAFKLDAWQRAVTRVVFGWKRPDGSRRFRVVYVEIPRKNGKTGFAAGIGLFLTFADGEAGAEVYSAANDTEQAALAFNEAKTMRMQSEALSKRSVSFKRAIVGGGSAYRVLSSSVGNKDGLNAHGVIYDEMHASKERDLYDVLHTSTGARQQPLELGITTAGTEDESLCGEMHDYAIQVRDGDIRDPDFLPVLFGLGKPEAKAEDAPADGSDDAPARLADYLDPVVWARCNPNLGRTISVEYVAREAAKASLLPRYRNTFIRLHLNGWTSSTVLWLPRERWLACNRGPVTLDILAGRPCWGGLDLSSTTDLTALALVSPWPDWLGWDVWAHFWMPEDTLRERSLRDRVPYEQWAADGWITPTPGNVVDYDIIRRDLTGHGPDGKRLAAAPRTPFADVVDLRELAIDRWNATQITTQLTGDGLTVVPFGQGYASLSAPAKELERLVLDRGINHGGNPVLRWMAGCVSIKTDPAGNIKPAKPNRLTSRKRIDGIAATIMGLGRAMVAERPVDLAALLGRVRAA